MILAAWLQPGLVERVGYGFGFRVLGGLGFRVWGYSLGFGVLGV